MIKASDLDPGYQDSIVRLRGEMQVLGERIAALEAKVAEPPVIHPWAASGVSKATYYRRKKKEEEST